MNDVKETKIPPAEGGPATTPVEIQPTAQGPNAGVSAPLLPACIRPDDEMTPIFLTDVGIVFVFGLPEAIRKELEDRSERGHVFARFTGLGETPQKTRDIVFSISHVIIIGQETMTHKDYWRKLKATEIQAKLAASKPKLIS